MSNSLDPHQARLFCRAWSGLNCLQRLSADGKKSFFSWSFFRNNIRVSNSLDPDQAPLFCRAWSRLNCLQRLSADGKKYFFSWSSFRNTIRVSNSLVPDQARLFCRAWSGSKLFAKVISRQQFPSLAFGPHRDKTCLLGFRQSVIQTSLLSYRD